MQVELLRILIHILNKTRILASKDKDVKISKYTCHHSETHNLQQHISVHETKRIDERGRRTHQEGAEVRATPGLESCAVGSQHFGRPRLVQSLAARPRIAEHDEVQSGRES